jgi:ADP-ribose pyrophosphatase YjhB (NUDIX family)
MQQTPHDKMLVRCRGIVIHEGKMLVVRHHGGNAYYALPGGHMDFGESPKECMVREMVEELGVEPQIGRLLYVHAWASAARDAQSIEFFFEINNGKDYLDSENLERTHAYELAEIAWVSPTDNVKILPERVGDDFKTGKILSDEVRFVNAF